MVSVTLFQACPLVAFMIFKIVPLVYKFIFVTLFSNTRIVIFMVKIREENNSAISVMC